MASLLLGRSTPSEPRSREAARTCAGLDRRAATEAIMIAVICNLSSSRRDMTEARAIGQHPMHDDREFACHRHLGFLHSASLGKLHPPALQCRAALQWLDQNDVGGLVKSCAYACIADFRDVAVGVSLARLVFGRRQAKIGPDFFR